MKSGTNIKVKEAITLSEYLVSVATFYSRSERWAQILLKFCMDCTLIFQRRNENRLANY